MGLHSALRLSFVSAVGASAGLSCKSDTGEDVDFAYGFKFPKGYEYAYMDAYQGLAKSPHTLDSSASFVSATLGQMGTSGVSYVVWNDQPPPKKDSQSPMAHAKGALVFGSEGGIWLTHSLPHFPTPVGQGSDLWKDASPDFGQSFLCITLEAKELHKLSPVFAINRPVIYDSKISEKEFSDLADLVDKKWDEQTMTTQVEVTSKGGQSFTVFGKSGKWGTGKDLYHDLVGKTLGDLKMEGWRRGRGVWGPACSEPRVLDITSVSFPGQSWVTENDHSKWAITQSSDKPALCVGDINRAHGQDERGGGTVCIRDAAIHKQIANVVNETDSCSDSNLLFA